MHEIKNKNKCKYNKQMNSFNDNSIENIFQYKKDLAIRKILNKEKKIGLELTKESQDSIKLKEKHNINELSFKKIKKIKDIMPQTNKSSKETLSYQNSYFPICLSFMTNTRNYLNSIDNKFKMRNNSNLLEQKSIEDNSTFYNNSILNNNNKSVSNKDYKKINLKLKFDKSKNLKNALVNQNFNPINYNHSRNIKFKLFDFTDNNSTNIKNYNFYFESADKSINIYNPKKIVIKQQKEKKNDVESDEELRNKIKLINKFVGLNLSRNKLRNILQEKTKLSKEASFEQKETIKNTSTKTLKIFKNIKRNDVSINDRNPSFLIPKILNKNKNISRHVSKNLKEENFNKSGKIIFKLKQNESDKKQKEESQKNKLILSKDNIKISSQEKKEIKRNGEKRKSKKRKTKKSLSKRLLRTKSTKKTKIKFNNIIPKKKKIKDIKDPNLIFLNEIKEDNDTNQKNKKINKEIKSNKISKILIQKINLDKIISKQKEKLKTYAFSFNLNKQLELEKESIIDIYQLKMKINLKTYLQLKKYSILFILLNAYFNNVKKCALDIIMLNYIRLNVEFSSIYLPVVKLGHEKSLLITDKLFSFKNYRSNNNLLQMAKSKFVETKKYQKGEQNITLNFITKELFYYNTNQEDINYLDEYISEKIEEEPAKIQKLSLSSKKLPTLGGKKKSGLLQKNTAYKRMVPTISLSLLEKKKIFDSPKKRIEIKLRHSLKNNLLLYKISGNHNINKILSNSKNIKDKLNKQYLNRAMSIIHDHKIKRENRSLDYFEFLRKITGKENIEIILRAFIQEGETALFTEYFNNNYRRIDINVKDEDGNTFLILSVKQGLDYIIKTLLEKGVDVNIQNNDGNSALHFALSSKNFNVADLLKKFGAKEDCYNASGYTPWDCVGKAIDINN